MHFNYLAYLTSPRRIPIAPFNRIVRIIKPTAQLPRQFIISIQVGEYWANSPMGVGIEPGINNPIPFSTQMPRNIAIQIKGSTV